MTPPTCFYCEQPYSDPRGCEYVDDDPRPVAYGSETEGFADLRGWSSAALLSESDRCGDCGVERGELHHIACLAAECATCHHQFGLCAGVECDDVWRWSSGETHPARRPAA